MIGTWSTTGTSAKFGGQYDCNKNQNALKYMPGESILHPPKKHVFQKKGFFVHIHFCSILDTTPVPLPLKMTVAFTVL